MIRSSLLVVAAVCGLWAANVDAQYYPLYGVPAIPAYVPPYNAYQVPQQYNAGVNYYGNTQQDKPATQYDQQDTKYYYGGKFQGTCSNDGLYYKDETSFVICSNGYASEQPCPPGTKTSGYPSYTSGYYYGYTDLCSVNLVDYGYGPTSYVTAAAEKDEYRDKSYGEKKTTYSSSYVKDSYSTAKTSSAAAYPTGTTAYQTPKAPAYQTAAYPAKAPSAPAYGNNEYKNTYPQVNPYQLAAETPKSNYQALPSGAASSPSYVAPSYSQQPASSNSNPYVPSAYPAPKPQPAPYSAQAPKDNYQPQPSYQSKGTSGSYPAADTVYAPRDDYNKVTYPAAKGPAYPSTGDKRY